MHSRFNNHLFVGNALLGTLRCYRDDHAAADNFNEDKSSATLDNVSIFLMHNYIRNSIIPRKRKIRDVVG